MLQDLKVCFAAQDKVVVIYSVGYPPRLVPAINALGTPTRIAEAASAARRRSGVGLVGALSASPNPAPGPGPAPAPALAAPLQVGAPAPHGGGHPVPNRIPQANPYSALLGALMPKSAVTGGSASGRRLLRADAATRDRVGLGSAGAASEVGAEGVGAAAAPVAELAAARNAWEPPEWDGVGPLPEGWALEPDSRGVRELGEQRRLLEEHLARAKGRGLGEVARRELATALVREASQYGRVSYVRPRLLKQKAWCRLLWHCCSMPHP